MKKKMELFASQDPRSYSFYFDLNIWFRACKVTGTFEKRAPGRLLNFWTLRVGTYSRWAQIRGWTLIRINTVTYK